MTVMSCLRLEHTTRQDSTGVTKRGIQRNDNCRHVLYCTSLLQYAQTENKIQKLSCLGNTNVKSIYIIVYSCSILYNAQDRTS